MARARDLVRDFVLAGFTKIHLDASMRLADDPSDRPLDETTVAQRAADLCAVAEAAMGSLPANAPRPVYVVGSEVPIPGGELADFGRPGGDERRRRRAHAGRDASRVHGVRRRQRPRARPGARHAARRGVRDAVIFAYDERAAAALAPKCRTSRRWSTRRTPRTTSRRRPLARWSATTSRSSRSAPALPSRSGRRCSRWRRSSASGWSASRGRRIGLRDNAPARDDRAPRALEPFFGGAEEELRFARDFSFSDRSRYYWPSPRCEPPWSASSATSRPTPSRLPC